MVKKITKRCDTCQKKENGLDNCDECQKEFCYQCLGRIENHLYCDTCYRQKEGLKNTDQIIKSAKEVEVYKKNEKGRKVSEKLTIYS